MISIPSRKNSTPMELNVLRYLQPRMSLSAAEKINYNNLTKGYRGERKLHDILDKRLSSDYLIINDLRLKVNHTEFQIDILLIGQNKIYPLEVNNYEGDFYIQKDNWYSVSSGNEIRNPLHQLKRSELLLQKFLQHIGINFSIEPYIIFINPEFYLYQATLDLPIIFPTQVNRFIQQLNAVSFNQTGLQQDLAKQFTDRHLYQSSHERLPDYQYEALRKGIVCKSCTRYLAPLNYKILICKSCGDNEDVESAVKRSIVEFTTLFPNKKITTSTIHEWCYVIESKKSIRRILKKHMDTIGKGRHTYYTLGK